VTKREELAMVKHFNKLRHDLWFWNAFIVDKRADIKASRQNIKEFKTYIKRIETEIDKFKKKDPIKVLLVEERLDG
jgi:hypothetical protein